MGIKSFTIFWIHKYSSYLILSPCWILYIPVYFLIFFFLDANNVMTWRNTFLKFSDVLPSFTGASVIGNNQSICLIASVLITVPWITFIRNISHLKSLKSNSMYS